MTGLMPARDTEACGAVALEAPTWGRELARLRWVHRTATLQGLSFRFAVRCTDAVLGRHMDRLLAPLRTPVPAAHWYSVVSGVGGVDVFLDNRLVARAGDAAAAVEWLFWDINRAVADETKDHILFHAGGVQAVDQGVLLPGPSGSGKSTLVAALVRSGLRYLSDEVVALSLENRALLSYPKSIAVGPGSLGLLAELQPRCLAASPDPDQPPSIDRKWYLPPSDIRADALGSSCETGLVIFPRYERGASTYLRRLSPSDALVGLVTNTVGLDRHGAPGLEVLAGIAERCGCYELVMDDLLPACRLVLALTEQ